MTFSQFLLLASWQDADKKAKYSINTFGVGMFHKYEGLGCRFWGSVGSLGVVSGVIRTVVFHQGVGSMGKIWGGEK